MSQSSVIIFGYGELGIAAARALAGAGARIIALVAPGNRSGADVDRFAAFGVEQQIPVWVQPPRRDIDPFVQRVRAAAPDVIVVWSYSMMLPQALLDVPRFGAVNVHGGLLPEYRGGHVMQWALINGDTETGATLHYLDAGLDTGPVIAESRFPIQAGDDAVRVRVKLAIAGADLLRQWWPRVADGTAPRTPQDQTRARYWPMRTPEDGRIDWTATSERICRLVRALACNEPGAFVEVDGAIVTVKDARAVPASSATPGRVESAGADGVRVSCADGGVVISTVTVGGVIMQDAAVAGILRPGASLVQALRQAHE